LAQVLCSEGERFDKVLRDLQQGDPARPLSPPRNADVQHRLHEVEKAWQGNDAPAGCALSWPARASGARAAARPLRRRTRTLRQQHQRPGAGDGAQLRHDTNLLRSVQAALVLLAVIGTAILIRFFMSVW
jgi:two-component system nitrate/nitrite sensor histidine kinase NarX